ncbi:hypothetical protein LguiA_030844 [Lonicera macranthoides]
MMLIHTLPLKFSRWMTESERGNSQRPSSNKNRKITCDSELENHIARNLYDGHATYRLEGFRIKCTVPSAAIVAEKFSPSTIVTTTCGNPNEFSIIGNVKHVLRATESSRQDISCSRDAIVLTIRLFVMRAGENKKGKKRGLFFNK